MKWQEYVNRAKAMPLNELSKKVFHLANRKFKNLSYQIRDFQKSTYGHGAQGFNHQAFLTSYDAIDVSALLPELNGLVLKYLNHEFDLLGSGWVKVHHGVEAKGLEGYKYSPIKKILPDDEGLWLKTLINSKNYKTSKKIWSLIKKPYAPIDWQIDFKSGYRWNESTWWNNIPYGHQPGVDIKVPWELSRMQHLPLLAHAWIASCQKNISIPSVEIEREIRNQILDFIATNPPRFGVNWKCPMDVAIRAANWVLTIELLRTNGFQFDQDFEEVVSNSLIDHGEFIFNHLERTPGGFRGNHYLADICGLAYIAHLLKPSSLTKSWLDFSFNSLIEECEYQFHPDGSNFEGSTSYHRLSAEMFAFTIALFLTKEEYAKEIPQWVFHKLWGMAQFSSHITRHDHRIPQIGDTDSGRFFKLHPIFVNSSELSEDHLDHRPLIKAIRQVFNSNKNKHTFIDEALISRFCISIKPQTPKTTPIASRKNLSLVSNFEEKFNRAADSQKRSYSFKLPQHINKEVEFYSYKHFGLYIYKSEDFYLSVRCGPTGQKGHGGHDHNDQLSIELWIDQKPIILDPGTYIYTPFPDKRNKYRSVLAHFTPQTIQQEQRPLNQGLFYLSSSAEGKALSYDEKHFLGSFGESQNKFYRLIKLLDKKIEIYDLSEHSKLMNLNEFKPLPYSRGYGLVDSGWHKSI